MAETDPKPDLSLTPEQMREFGYRVIDAITEQFETVRKQPALRRRTRADMEALFREPIPEQPAPAPGNFAAILDRVREDVFTNYAPLDHPRFFAFVPSPINFISVMAEALAAAYNPFMGSWMVSPGPTQIELVTIDWLRELCGLPDSAGGLFVSGGSMANLNAIAMARQIKLEGDMTGAVVYCSAETHSSIDRAMHILGFKPEQLIHIDTDTALRLDPRKLREAVEADLTAGRRPFCVIGSAGTTNTGAIDPLPTIADFCVDHDMWMHVDGAYGAPALLTAPGKVLLNGIERADSITMDPHKWLFQPYEIGCLLTRDRRHLVQTFHVFKDYMQDVVGDDEEVNLRDHGVQLTRNFRALKLWMSLQYFGLDAFREAIVNGIHMAEFAETLLRDDDHRKRWEVVTPASIGIICFRYLPEGIENEKAIDAVNLELIDAMYDDGYAMVSSTSIRGRPVLRLCPINPRTTKADIEGTIEKFEQFANDP